MSTLNVLIVNDFSAARGGATKVALRCVEAARDAGARVSALFGDDGDGVEARYPGLNFRALGQAPLKSGVSLADVVGKTYNGAAVKALDALLDEMDPDGVVHVHGWSQILSPAIFRVLAARRARVVVTAHDFFLACPNGAFLDFRSGELCHETPLSAGCLMRNCDKRSYGQKLWRAGRMAVQRSAGDEFWSRIAVVLAHEDMTERLRRGPCRNFTPLRTPTTPFLDEQAWPAENKEIGFIGRMTWEKGVITLATALRDTGLGGFMIGEGPLLEKVRAIAPHVYAPGWADDAEVARRMAGARMVAMPSAMPEPYGLVAVEAIRSGLPVVVSDACLIARELDASGAGVAFPSNDSAALGETLRALSEDDARIAAMGETAYALGREFEPSDADWARTMVDMYRAAADGRAPYAPPNPVWARYADEAGGVATLSPNLSPHPTQPADCARQNA